MKIIKMVNKCVVSNFGQYKDVLYYLFKKDGTYVVSSYIDTDMVDDSVEEVYIRLQTGELKPIFNTVYKPETPLSVGTVITVYAKDGECKTVCVLSIGDDRIEVIPLKTLMKNAIITRDYLIEDGLPLMNYVLKKQECQEKLFKFKLESCVSESQLMVIKYKDIELILEDVL